MQKRLKKMAVGLVAVGLCLALLCGSVVPAKADEERVVKLGCRSCFTGPLATTIAAAHYGQFDYVRYLNEHGGIDGIKVEYLWRECRTDPALAIAAHRRFKEAGVLIETSCDTGASDATLAVQGRDAIPFAYAAPLDPKWFAEPGELQWYAGYYGPVAYELYTFMKWAGKNWAEEGRPLRMGLVLADFIVGHTLLEGVDLAKKLNYTDEVGIEIIGYEMVPFLNVLDTSVEWLRLAAKKPDVVFVSHYGAGLCVVIKDAYRLEIQQKGIKLVGEMAAIDEVALRTAGAASEGWYCVRAHPCPATEPNLPGVPIAVEHAKKYRGMKSEEVPSHYVGGWHHSRLLVEVIRRAIEKVGFENLTGRAVRDVLFNFSGFDIGFMPAQYVYVTEERPWIMHAFRMGRCHELKIVPISDFYEEVILKE